MDKILDFKLFEYNTNLSDKELLEMANVTSEETGIDDVVIWIGPNPQTHSYRVKVSNIPNKISSDNLFTITIPNLNVVGIINNKFIDSKKLEKIFNFIKLNQNIIMDYSDYKISTKQLLDNLQKI
jgi:hypothetical protein